MSEKRHSIKYNFLMDFILKASGFVFPIITFPYVSRVLSPEGLGHVSFATGVISYFQLFAALGIPTYGVRLCSKYRDDRERLSQSFQELTIIYLFTTLLSYVAFAVCMLTIPTFQAQKALLLITSSNIFLHLIGFDWLYTAVEQYRYITIRSLVMKVLAVIALFVFVHDVNDYVVYGTITVLSNAGSNLFNLFYSKKFISWKPIGKYALKPHIKPIFVLFAMSVAGSIYTQLDTVMLGFMHSSYEVGIYTTAVKLKNILLSLTVALGGVMLPRLSYYVQNKREKEFKTLSAYAFNIITYITVPLCIYFFIFAEESIGFLAGVQYGAAIISMRVIMPTVLLVSLTNMMGYQILVPTNRENKVLISVVIGAIVDFLINLLLIPSYGSLGASIGTLIAELCVLVVQVLYLRTYFKEIRGVLRFQYVLLPTGIAIAAIVPIKVFLHTADIVELIVSACAFFGVYAVVFLLEKEPFVTGQLRVIFNSLKQKKKR